MRALRVDRNAVSTYATHGGCQQSYRRRRDRGGGGGGDGTKFRGIGQARIENPVVRRVLDVIRSIKCGLSLTSKHGGI